MRERSDKRKPTTKRTKIAPRLRRLVEHEAALPCHPNGRWTKESGDLYYRSTQELRALLAVVRAAEAVNRADDDGAGTTMPLEFWRPMRKLSDALSRLRRASREG